MSLILPIVLAGLYVGLFVRRVTAATWGLLIGWITLVVAVNFVKS
jgi:hypothetical protein